MVTGVYKEGLRERKGMYKYILDANNINYFWFFVFYGVYLCL